MKNHYKKKQLSFSRELLKIMFNDKSSLIYTNSELDFLTYTVLRNMNDNQQKIYFTKSEIRKEVYYNKINSKNISKIFKTFNVKHTGNGEYCFSYTYDYLYIFNKNKKGDIRKRSYKTMPIDTWLQVQSHNGRYTRILALYLTYIHRDFPISINNLYKRINFNIGINKTRSLNMVKKSLDFFMDIELIKDYKVTQDKILIQFTGEFSFSELSKGIKFNNISSKQKTLIRHNDNDAMDNLINSVVKKHTPVMQLNTDIDLHDNDEFLQFTS